MGSILGDVRGILFIEYREKGQTTNSNCSIGQLDRLKKKISKTAPYVKKQLVLSPGQSALWQVYGYDRKIARISLRIASTTPLLTRLTLEGLLPIGRPKKCSHIRYLTLIRKSSPKLDGNNVDEQNFFTKKVVFSLFGQEHISPPITYRYGCGCGFGCGYKKDNDIDIHIHIDTDTGTGYRYRYRYSYRYRYRLRYRYRYK